MLTPRLKAIRVYSVFTALSFSAASAQTFAHPNLQSPPHSISPPHALSLAPVAADSSARLSENAFFIAAMNPISNSTKEADFQRPAFKDDTALDPFLAGAMGFIPYMSGYYLGTTPAQGIVFTLIDIVLTAGVWNALHASTGDPDNAPLFILGMAANNAVDAYLSVRNSLRTPKLRITPVTLDKRGRVSSSLTYRF